MSVYPERSAKRVVEGSLSTGERSLGYARDKVVVIIDYGSGNLRSVAKAFEHVAAGKKILVTSKASDLATASHIVLPGVGAFGDCMRGLTALDGMLAALCEQVLQKKKNFLGICVGMQMLFERGLEHGEHQGLGWLKGEVAMLKPSPLEGEGWVAGGSASANATNISPAATTPHLNPPPQGGRKFKIPHMGWNNLTIRRDHPILRGIKNGDHTYFVHSYHARAAAADILATTDYGGDVAAIVGRENIVGTQFHPEKSQETGLAILKNFLEL